MAGRGGSNGRPRLDGRLLVSHLSACHPQTKLWLTCNLSATVCAAANGHLAVVDRLVNQAGADPLIRSIGGETAADIAEGVSNTEIHEVRPSLKSRFVRARGKADTWHRLQMLEKAGRERLAKCSPSKPAAQAAASSQKPLVNEPTSM